MPELLSSYYSLSAFIAFLFYFSTGLYLTLGIRSASSATRHLGLAFIYAGMLALPYFFSGIFYDKIASVHRYFTISAALLQFAHLARFFGSFPESHFPRFLKLLLFKQYAIALFVTGYFITQTADGPYHYHFDGHYWDFDADVLSRNVGVVIIGYSLLFLVVGIVQIFKSSGSRLALSSMLALAFFITFTTGLTNTLSRDGLLDRGFFQAYMVLSTVVGYFLLLIVFLNSTPDRSTFMAKVVGVSLVLFMVVFTIISALVFQLKEEAYDTKHQLQAQRNLLDSGFFASDQAYVVRSDFLQLSPGPAESYPFSLSQSDLLEDHHAAMVHSQLLAGKKLTSLPERSFFKGHAAFLSSQLASGLSAAEALQELSLLVRRLKFQRSKLGRIAEYRFVEGAGQDLEKWPAALASYKPAIREILLSKEASSEKKTRILRLLRPVYPPGARLYRRSTNEGAERHFVSFIAVDPVRGLIHESGYDYIEYRRFIAPFAWMLTALVTLVFLIIVVGFRFFFWGTLVKPLENLLEGVRRVNQGDLDHSMQVVVADEIGFLTRSFNRMVKSIKGARKRLERHADELEQKVRERTSELRETLATVEELKRRQDGDYFLTSLLIHPLSRNDVQSETLSVDFYIEQKKKFSFRKWEEELGGDLCSARSIELQDRACTIVLNADAMGKSMQGAGGALVLGAVFESLLERTLLAGDMKRLSPERWLKIAFQELQSVFESFDGTMLVSLILALIDDESGLLYFINAEHPWLVLYRNGRARFLEKELKFRKVGIPDLKGRLAIDTFQLVPGDVLLMGSDGRDDLLLDMKDGVRLINEDEELFLEVVTSGEGDLKKIVGILKEYGELTDDLSLARIAFKEEARSRKVPLDDRLKELQELEEKGQLKAAYELAEDILSKDSHEIHAMRMGARLALRLGDMRRAYMLAEDYHYFRPADTSMLYLYSFLARKHGEFELATELGERVRLRSPKLKQNLWNLIRAYIARRNFSRAGQLLEEFLEHYPGHERALELKQSLAGKEAGA